MARLWHAWLPSDLQPVVEQETDRFEALVAGFEKDVDADVIDRASKGEDGDGGGNIVSWIPLINNFLPEKTPYPAALLDRLAQILLKVVLNKVHDVEVQVRSAETLASLLRLYRKELTIQIEWRPLYALLRSHFLDAAPKLEGLTLAQTRLHSLCKVVRRSRRFFPDGSAAEIWNEFSIEMEINRAGLCFESVGWLLLFFPAHELSRTGNFKGINCDTLLDRWLTLWDSIVHSNFWNCHWMHLLAKLAKHDTHARLPWQKHLDLIFTHILWVYQVPVGTAVANTPIHETVSGMGKYLFMSQIGGLSRNAGKLIVYLLRDPLQPKATHPVDPSQRKTISYLQSLVDLLHQYYHPSNGGSWTTDLTKLLHSLVKHCMKQLSHQGSNPTSGNTHLAPDTQQQFVDCIITLASMAQFSKHDSLSNSAVKALAQMAYIAPEKVLPLVFNRFQTALETATATHQLVAAIAALGSCVRPMLLTGWSPDSDPTTTHHMLSQAMMALLPGIDANDEAKTLAVMSFYRSVLSSIPYIQDPEEPTDDKEGRVFSLPVYWEEWLDELVSRCFALLENLDASPAHHGADHATSHHEGSTFLVGSGDMTYTTFIGILFAKLPERFGNILVKRVADFVLGGTLQGVVREACVFVNGCATHYQELTKKLIIRPLMQRLLEETPESGSSHLSHNLESTIRWHANLLREALYPLKRDLVLDMLSDCRPVLNRVLRVNSKSVQVTASTLLGALILCMVRHRLPEGRCSGIRVGEYGLEGWVDKTGSGLPAPDWNLPEAKHLEAAEKLMQEYLMAGCRELEELSSGAAVNGAEATQAEFKQQLQTALSKIRGVLIGLMRHFPDFTIPAGPGLPITVVGPQGGMVGAAGVREQVAASLVKASRMLRGRDAETLGMLVSAMSILLCNGNLEYNAWVKSRSDQRRIATAVIEPAASTYLQPAGTEWRKRWPLWVAMDEVRIAWLWRESQSTFRNFATAGRPNLDDPDQLPAVLKELVSELVSLSTHQYKAVRNEAVVAMEVVCKRYTGLAELLVAQYLSTLSTATLADPFSSMPALADTIQRAMDTAAEEAGSVGKKEPGEGKTESEQDGVVLGASSVLNSCITMRRLLFRSPQHFKMLLQALMASRQYTSTASQAGINELLLGICGRLKPPPSLAFKSPDYTSLASQFLQLSKPTTQASRWRHTLLANIFTLFLLPPVDSPIAPEFTRHFLVLFMSDVLLLRQVAVTGLFFQLLSIVDHGKSAPAVVQAIQDAISNDPQFLPALLKHMSNGHANLDMHEANKDKRGGSALSYGSMLLNMTFEQIITRVVSALATRFYLWPEGADIPVSLSEGWFEVGFAAFARLLTCIAPVQFLQGMQQPLTDLAERVVVPNGGSDKAEQCTCAEVTAGLLASGAPFSRLAASAGDPSESCWVLALLERGFKDSPAELVNSWGFAVRFALRGLVDAVVQRRPVEAVGAGGAVGGGEGSNAASGNAADAVLPAGSGVGLAARRRSWQSAGVSAEDACFGIKALLSLVLELKPSGDGPGQLLAQQKQLQLIAQCVGELRQSGAMEDEVLVRELSGFWSGLVEQLGVLAAGELYSVREHLGGLLVEVVDLFNVTERLPWPPPENSSAMQVDEGAEASVTSSPAPMETEAPTTHNLPDAVDSLASSLLQRFFAAVSSLQALKNNDEHAAGATAPTANGTTAGHATSTGIAGPAHIAHAGFGLQFINKSIRKGRSAKLRPLLATLIPGLMQLQELAGPQVQHLSLEAKSSFVLVKYVPLLPPHVPVVVDTILHAAGSTSWSTRAAALVYLQYFWFRHRFLLSGPDLKRLEDLVVGRLQDDKAEVRGIAAATLSGMLKAIPAEHATTLRSSFVSRAKQVLGKKRGRAAAAPAPQPTLLEKQACVQGLKAFVIAHPYDCPRWMPDVLLALAAGANDAAAQVRTDIHKALAEFKRTHEQDSIEELKGMMDSDQWDSVHQLTSQASYFT